jgi:hypothetical protein
MRLLIGIQLAAFDYCDLDQIEQGKVISLSFQHTILLNVQKLEISCN